jgi:hypothetical protein
MLLSSLRGEKFACGAIKCLDWHKFGEQKEDCAGNHHCSERNRHPQDAITVIIYEAPKENWASEDNCTLKGSMSSLAPDRNSSSFEIAFC